jgi:hypothetical protein
MSQKINQYPYNVPTSPLLFHPPKKLEFNNRREQQKYQNEIPQSIYQLPGATSASSSSSYLSPQNAGMNMSKHQAMLEGRLPIGEVPSNFSRYQSVPRGTSPAHYQSLIKATTVYNRSQTAVVESVITVSSADRIQQPIMTPTGVQVLENNALTFTAGSNNVNVYLTSHGLQQDSYVVLTGVNTTTTTINQPFEARAGCNFIRIEVVGGAGLSAAYGTLDNLFVQISGVTNSLGNLPPNLINGIHNVYLTCPYSNFPSGITGMMDTISFNFNNRFFYIQVPVTAATYFSDRTSPINNPTNPEVQFQFLFIGGVPLYFLNCGFPSTLNNYDPYLQVSSIIDQDNFTVTLRQAAVISMSGGGNTMQVTSLSDVGLWYPDPNQYQVDLPQECTNVTKVELVGCDVPYSGFLVQLDTNDSIFWQLLNDSTGTTYSASILRGNYRPETLAPALETAMNSIIRNDTLKPHEFTVTLNEELGVATFFLKKTDTISNGFLLEYVPPYGIGTVTPGQLFLYFIDSANEANVGDSLTLVQGGDFLDPLPLLFSSLLTSQESSAFTVTSISVLQQLDALAANALTPVTTLQMLATRKNALLQLFISLGYSITITNTTLASGVVYPYTTASSVLPYFLQVSIPLNLISSPPATYELILNSEATTIFYNPSQFRFDFSQENTLGSILGFRNPGQNDSISAYSATIQNIDLYEYEQMLGFDSSIGLNTTFNFHGPAYLFLCCPELSSVTSTAPSTGATASSAGTTGGVTNIFTKIYLCGRPGHRLWNTQDTTPFIYPEPLASISTLTLSFVTSDGVSYNFNGLDHTLTFKITQLHSLPEDTGYNTHTGQLLEEIQAAGK